MERRKKKKKRICPQISLGGLAYFLGKSQKSFASQDFGQSHVPEQQRQREAPSNWIQQLHLVARVWSQGSALSSAGKPEHSSPRGGLGAGSGARAECRHVGMGLQKCCVGYFPHLVLRIALELMPTRSECG